ALQQMGDRRIQMGFRVVGLPADRLVEETKRAIDIAELLPGISEVVVSLRHIRLERDGAFVTGNRLVEAPKKVERDTAIVVGGGQFGIARERLLMEFEGTYCTRGVRVKETPQIRVGMGSSG